MSASNALATRPEPQITELPRRAAGDIMFEVLAKGDLSNLTNEELARYEVAVCESLGLNPLTKPFDVITLPGNKKTNTPDRKVLYANRNAGDQLAKLYQITRQIVSRELVDGVYVVTARVTMPDGRSDESIGAVPLLREGGRWKRRDDGEGNVFEPDGTYAPLPPDQRANKMMHAECCPLDSEILTRNGFRAHDSLTIGEDVLAYDPATDQCLWTPLQAVTTYESAPLIRLANSDFSALCTPNHSWAVHKKGYTAAGKGDRGSRGPYRNRKPDRFLVEARAIKTSHHIILAAPERQPMESRLSPVEAAVLGWAVTDGTIKRTGNSVSIGICQSKEHNFAPIRELVAVVAPGVTERVTPGGTRTFPGGNTSETLPQHWWYIPAAVTRAILDRAGFHDVSDLPSIVTRLDSPARVAMLQSMMLADADAGGTFAKSKPSVIEAFEILCALEGYATGGLGTHGPVKTKTRKSTRHVAGAFLEIKPAGESPVWCPTTAYGTWVMRQNGRVMITGNTKAKRRAVLSLVGLSMLDESELDTLRAMTPAQPDIVSPLRVMVIDGNRTVDPETGEITTPPVGDRKAEAKALAKAVEAAFGLQKQPQKMVTDTAENLICWRFGYQESKAATAEDLAAVRAGLDGWVRAHWVPQGYGWLQRVGAVDSEDMAIETGLVLDEAQVVDLFVRTALADRLADCARVAAGMAP